MIMVTADIYLKVSRIVNLMEFPLHGMRNMSQIFLICLTILALKCKDVVCVVMALLVRELCLAHTFL